MNTLHTLTLESTVYTLEQLKTQELPQVALAGRSNVGKSSLLNALAGRKKLAKTSATPGKTRSINFYRVLPENFFLVDLPGYGYAKCGKEEQERWAGLIEQYLLHTKSLKALAVLLDCRLPPQKADLDLLAFAAQSGLPALPIITKADKCSKNEQNERCRAWQSIAGRPPILSSAQSRLGLEEVWSALRELVAP